MKHEIPEDGGGSWYPNREYQESDRQGHPSCFSPGVTLRQRAAIDLCVPCSGLPWLNEMIRESLRNKFAGRALNAVFANAKLLEMVVELGKEKENLDPLRSSFGICVVCADEILAELAKQGPPNATNTDP